MSFHVPERFRLRDGRLASSEMDGNNGAFLIQSCVKGWSLVLICSDGMGFEHVSVHAEKRRASRIPTWEEMCHVKDTCWDGEDVVMQLHPRQSEYVNNHADVLHLWRPTDREIPTPHAAMVGVKSAGILSPVDAEALKQADEIYRRCNSDLQRSSQ